METTKAKMVHYVVDARLSRFTVQAFAGGFLSAFAHSPKFAIRGISSKVRLDPANLELAELRIEIRANFIQLLDEVSDKDHREIERAMREEALEANTHPTIFFESTSVSATRIADGQYNLSLAGDLSLHGVTRRLTIPARVALAGDTLRAFGEFSLKQTDYHIKLVAVAGGAIKVKDELKFSFDLVARKQG
ncbi:MAG TPA: YceI family protein [Terriglobia bacterium]|nr:YceI family protein [Terriglobia bacterium]